MSDIAIKVENLSKYYKLGVINNGTLFKDIQSYMARLRGKEDPNAKIGATYDDNAEGFWALKDLNFEIKKGDRVGIIGHNGAGKSTLLKVLSQITSPTKGNIKINGRVASLLEVGTGFHPELTGRENIYMNGAILGMKKAEIDKKVDQIIEFSEIGKYIDTPVKRYSSGMYVRLAFAVAAHLDSEILIADEVLAVGDTTFQKKALRKMGELSSGEGRTILFVSHQMAAVRNLCNTGIVLNHGRIEYSGNLNKCIDIYNGAVDKNIDGKLFLRKDFDDEYVSFLEYSICDNKNVIYESVISNKKEFYVDIKSEIKRTHNNLIYFITLYDSMDNIIWNTDIFESKQISPADLHEGKIHLQLKVPFNYLNNGSYKLSVTVMIHYHYWIIQNFGNYLLFEINNQYSQHPVYEYGNHPLTGADFPGLIIYPCDTKLLM